MPDQSFELDVLGDLLDEAATIGALSADEQQFQAAYRAFRARKRDAFLEALKGPGLVARCRLVCEWIRIKECVFLCLHLAGPPTAETKRPSEAAARCSRAVGMAAPAFQRLPSKTSVVSTRRSSAWPPTTTI